MTVTFTSQDVTYLGKTLTGITEVNLRRIVDITHENKIVTRCVEFGNLVLFEGGAYPANGIFDKTKTDIENSVKTVLGIS